MTELIGLARPEMLTELNRTFSRRSAIQPTARMSLHIFQPIKGKTGDNLNFISGASKASEEPVIPPLDHSNRVGCSFAVDTG